MMDFEKSGTLNTVPNESKTKAKSDKKTKARNSVTALAKMFDGKPSGKEKKATPTETLDKIKNEAISQEELADIDYDSEEDEIKNRKKASTFSQRLNMFNRNAPDSTRKIKKDLEQKDLRIYNYDKVIEEKKKNEDWIPTADYEGQLTSRRKIDKIESEANLEIMNKEDIELAEQESIENKNYSKMLAEIEADGIDDVFDDIYIAKMDKKKEESKPVRIDIPAEKVKKPELPKNINFNYKQLDTSNDISLSQEPVINISNLSINQNNYNPIFNSYTTEDRKENEIEITNDITHDDQQVFGKNSKKLMWSRILRYKYFFLAVLIIILIVMLVTFFIY